MLIELDVAGFIAVDMISTYPKNLVRPTPFSLARGDFAPSPINWFWLGTMIAIATVIRLWIFRGFVGSDDVVYATRGLEIADGVWSRSDYVGALRYGMNIPIAGAVAMFGRSEGVLAGWGLLCSLVEIGIVFAFASRTWGTRVAVYASLILALMPQHIRAATAITADAPFAVFLALSMALLYLGATTHKATLLVCAGLSLGFAGWIKPEPAIIFSISFGLTAMVFLQERRHIVWPVVGAVVAVLLNMALFAWAFDAPFYYAEVTLYSSNKNNGVMHSATWQHNDAYYYLRLLFLDGREYWLAPFLALFGAWIALRVKSQKLRHAGWFTVVWLCLLLFLFSVFVYSVSPIRLIPKQVNYALMFMAPIALLAGVALARARAELSIVLTASIVVGGIFLAVLDGYRNNLRAATHRDTISYAQSNSSSLVFSSIQTLHLNNVLGLMGQANASNLHKLSDMFSSSLTSDLILKGETIVVAVHPDWFETQSDAGRLFLERVTPCVRQVTTRVGGPNASEALAVKLIRSIRGFLPYWADRQFAFTDRLLFPEAVSFYHVDPICLASFASSREVVR